MGVKPMPSEIHKHNTSPVKKQKKSKAQAHHHCLYPPKMATNAKPCERAPRDHPRRHTSRPSQHLYARAAMLLRCATNTNKCSKLRLPHVLWAIVVAFQNYGYSDWSEPSIQIDSSDVTSGITWAPSSDISTLWRLHMWTLVNITIAYL